MPCWRCIHGLTSSLPGLLQHMRRISRTTSRLMWEARNFTISTSTAMETGLAPSHLALRSPSKIKIVDYDVGKKSRADMKASGRRKKDAQVLEENSSLCKVSSEDAEFLVRCCIRGQLLEVNERLTSDPSLLSPSLARLHCDSNAKARSMEKGREITPHSRAIQAAKNATGMIIYPSLLQFFAELLFFVRDLCLRPPLLTNWKNSSGKQYFVTHTIKTPP
ncbi:uncharacterized protein LOC9644515 isoform X2 [Selaginella moellendorffii]|uniref:uncharacterized protein LOC9644515 isoform X2 n=1 Tax=Selaginella moellendorffii TaxID=88036 RepID=UPI000D1CF8F2|nr:uncharacterized protein LOC9644515 isoform X2 [Selaginella moellendorffii]|eukprot:XP_024544855.1 uncharacterized protein LOC9644515 isoform X2 [Selaginella moellendorffii]